MTLTILIPCLNEEKTIARCVQVAQATAKKLKLTHYEILVADNGSTDHTIQRLQRFKNQKNVRIMHVRTKGYGAALHYGILSAKYSYIFFADADLSYDFHQLVLFLPAIQQKNDLILGSRFLGKIEPHSMPFLHQYFGTPLLTFLIRMIYRIPTTDCNSGMRVVKKSFYKKILMKNNGMEWASELLVKTALLGGKYSEVPITFRKDQRGKHSHLKSWRDGWRHLKVIVLLKPFSFVIAALLSIVFAALSISFSQVTALSWVLLSEFFSFSFLILKELEEAMTNRPNRISHFLNGIPLVVIGIIFTTFAIAQLLVLPGQYSMIKIFVIAQVLFFDIWLFFIETIKTHLISPLHNTNIHAAV